MRRDLDALLLRAFESAPTSLSLSDADGRIIGGNRAFWELFGHERGTDLVVSTLTRSDDRPWTQGYLRQLIDGDLDEFETAKRFVRADGSEFDGLLTIRALRADSQVPSSDFLGMIATVEPTILRPRVDDIRVGKILEHAAGTLTLIDADGEVIETSGRYRATLGYPAEFWEGRTILDILVPEDAARVLAMREDVVSEPGREVTGDFRVVAADQTVETLEVTATNLLDDPEVGGILITSRNVSADRATTLAVSRLRDEAVAEVERRTNLLATVSHELRNPLHAMAGIAELLASDPRLPSDQHDMAATLQRQLLHLTSVTDDLLDTARLDVGEFRLNPRPTDVRSLVDDVVTSSRSAAAGRLVVTATVDDDVPRVVTVDPTRLTQIVGNLVGNAVKFTDAGSVTVDVATDDDRLVIVVNDTGRGIAEDSTEDLFTAYTTLPSGGDRRGAGLGLAIVRRLVEAMEGSIDVESQVGVGTRFTVVLPLVEGEPDDAGSADAPAPTAVDGPRRRRVLVVEDTPVNQELARAQLDRLAIDAVIAESAEAGIELLETETFDAVLMDHQLPGMNGRDATHAIRSRGWTVPVVGVTASSTAADEQASLEAGMNAFLAKPVGLDGLRTTLDEIWRTTASDAADGDASGPGGDATRVDADAAVAGSGTVDTGALDVLVDELGDRSIVVALVGSFLSELDVRSDDIAGPDADLAARQAHTLKSSAAMLGATRLAEVCARAERDASARPLVAELVGPVRAELLAWTRERNDS